MGMGLNIEMIEVPVYTCAYCGATFGSQEDLDTHIRIVHIAGIPEWLKTNWKTLAIGGSILAVGIAAAVVVSRKK